MQLIFDASKQYIVDSVPVNRMTFTHLGTEMQHKYGDLFWALLEQLYDLRITYPNKDVITHANDIRSFFKQLKLQPDVMA